MPDGRRKGYPEDLECGSGWQLRYMDLHRDMLAGRREPRLLVAKGRNGLGDHLRSAVSM